MTWDELSGLDMGSWFSPYLYKGEKIIRLKSLFDRYHDQVQYHIEFKNNNPDLIEVFLKTMGEYGLKQHIIVTSFSYDCLLAIKNLDEQLRLGWLVREVTDDVIGRARQSRFFQFCPRIDLMTPEMVSLLHESFPEVRAWGLTAKREENVALLQKAIRMNCDGVTINWPDWIQK